jgi:hypothetical protein
MIGSAFGHDRRCQGCYTYQKSDDILTIRLYLIADLCYYI